MKTKTITTIFAVLSALFAMGLQNDTQAWVSWGPVWSDNEIPLPMEARSSGTGDCTGLTEFGSLSRAGRTWNAESCSYFSFRVGPGHPNNRSAPVQDGVNNITWDYGYGGLAVTYGWWFGSNRQECDIIFNEAYNWSCSGNPGFNQYDAETVGLHEMGHVLGLGHTNISQAVMYAYYQGVRRSLHSDDSNGICSLYPAGPAPVIEAQVEDFDF